MKDRTSQPVGKTRGRRIAEAAMFIAALLLIALLAEQRFHVLDRFRTPAMADVPSVRIGQDTFTVEVAADEETRRVGLSKRASIAADRGMLFVYPVERSPDAMGFWMKDCWMDIDIAFINAKRQIVTIHTMKCQPPGTTLETYPPTRAAQFALEARAGEFARRGVKVGDEVKFSRQVEAAIATAAP